MFTDTHQEWLEALLDVPSEAPMEDEPVETEETAS